MMFLKLLEFVSVRDLAWTLIKPERVSVPRKHVTQLAFFELVRGGDEGLFHGLLHAKSACHLVIASVYLPTFKRWHARP